LYRQWLRASADAYRAPSETGDIGLAAT